MYGFRHSIVALGHSKLGLISTKPSLGTILDIDLPPIWSKNCLGLHHRLHERRMRERILAWTTWKKWKMDERERERERVSCKWRRIQFTWFTSMFPNQRNHTQVLLSLSNTWWEEKNCHRRPFFLLCAYSLIFNHLYELVSWVHVEGRCPDS